MGPLLVLGGVGVLGLIMAAKGGSSAPALPPGQDEGSLGPPVEVTGSSGKRWKVQRVSNKGGVVQLDVYATAGSFGPHEEFRVLRYSQAGDDKNSRLLISAAPGIEPSIVQTALSDFGIRNPSAALVSPTTEKPMPEALKQAMANAMKLLTVDENGNIVGPVLPDAIRIATETAGRLDASGFPEAGSALRVLAQKASSKVPSPPKEKQIPLPPSIPASVQDQINRAIAMERDPAKLKALVLALNSLPPSKERDSAIEMLSALIIQTEAKQKTDTTLEEVDQVLRSPGIPQPTKAKTAPAPPKVTATPPAPIPVPAVPQPQPAPAAKTPVEMAAEGMVLNLKSVQSRFGVKGAKGKEDTTLVKRFQGLAGLEADGKAGPGTLAGAAFKGGQSDLPFVYYWPKSATADKVLQYRTALRNVAEIRRREGNVQAAQELEASAARERGQAGIVGPMPS